MVMPRQRRGFILMDFVLTITLIVATAGMLAVAARSHRRALDSFSQRRALTRIAEEVGWRIHAGESRESIIRQWQTSDTTLSILPLDDPDATQPPWSRRLQRVEVRRGRQVVELLVSLPAGAGEVKP